MQHGRHPNKKKQKTSCDPDSVGYLQGLVSMKAQLKPRCFVLAHFCGLRFISASLLPVYPPWSVDQLVVFPGCPLAHGCLRGDFVEARKMRLAAFGLHGMAGTEANLLQSFFVSPFRISDTKNETAARRNSLFFFFWVAAV